MITVRNRIFSECHPTICANHIEMINEHMCMLGVGGCPEQKGGVGRVSVEGDGFLQDHQGEKGGAWLL